MSPEARAHPGAAPETGAPGGGDYESLRQYVDVQLTLARDMIDSQREDYLKLKDVVEDRFNHHHTLKNEVAKLKAEIKLNDGKTATKLDVHEASGKVMERCEQLISETREPIKEFKAQVAKALLMVDGVQSNMDTFITGAFNICEANLKVLEKEVIELKDSSGPGVKLMATVRGLEEKISNLTQDGPKKSRWTSTATSPSNEKSVEFLYREFGNLRADLEAIKSVIEQDDGAGKQGDGAAKPNCHCKHLDELAAVVEQLMGKVRVLQN